MRIKEILKEKGVSVQELADTLQISRQALSRQIGGKLLVETAQRIADALGVPVWQLFVSPDDAARTNGPTCPHCGKPLTIKIS